MKKQITEYYCDRCGKKITPTWQADSLRSEPPGKHTFN